MVVNLEISAYGSLKPFPNRNTNLSKDDQQATFQNLFSGLSEEWLDPETDPHAAWYPFSEDPPKTDTSGLIGWALVGAQNNRKVPAALLLEALTHCLSLQGIPIISSYRIQLGDFDFPTAERIWWTSPPQDQRGVRSFVGDTPGFRIGQSIGSALAQTVRYVGASKPTPAFFLPDVRGQQYFDTLAEDTTTQTPVELVIEILDSPTSADLCDHLSDLLSANLLVGESGILVSDENASVAGPSRIFSSSGERSSITRSVMRLGLSNWSPTFCGRLIRFAIQGAALLGMETPAAFTVQRREEMQH